MKYVKDKSHLPAQGEPACPRNRAPVEWVVLKQIPF